MIGSKILGPRRDHEMIGDGFSAMGDKHHRSKPTKIEHMRERNFLANERNDHIYIYIFFLNNLFFRNLIFKSRVSVWGAILLRLK